MMKLLLIVLLTIAGTATQAQSASTGNKTPYLLVGTYTNGKSEGIYVYKFNAVTGEAIPVSVTKTDNPSFLVVSPDEKYVYAVNENTEKNNPGSIAAFSFDKSKGTLIFLNKQLSGGAHPVHVAIDKSGRWVTAANFSGGSIAVMPVETDGSLGKVVSVMQHQGKGTDSLRQEKPHVHSSMFTPDSHQLLVPDLGIDKVAIYDVNRTTGQLTPALQPFFKVKDGAGPRHLSFHPNGKFVYLAEEMGGSVVAFSYSGNGLKELQTISAHPDNYAGIKGSADIHVSPDGRFLYTSNRMDANSIAIFSINPETGLLKTAGFQSTLGKGPRNFNLDVTGNFLLAANQDTNEIVIFKINKQTGLLTDSGKRIPLEKPVCLQWIRSN